MKPVWASASSSVSPRALPAERWLRAGDVGRGRADKVDEPPSRIAIGIHWTGKGRCGTDRTEMGQLCTARPSCAVPLRQGTAAMHGSSPSRGGEKPHQHFLAACLLAGLVLCSLAQGMDKVSYVSTRLCPGLGSCTARCIRKDDQAGQGCRSNKGGALSHTI